MPLHLLGKKSWNVYNADNIARVKADEAAAAAREAADDQRMQELDAERRAAILRGRTPPPLPEAATIDTKSQSRSRGEDGRERKRRKLAGEDDTDMDIRLASNALPKADADDTAKILKIRSTVQDAPLTDHAGHIDLFPVDMKEAIKREKNAEVEKEKRKKEKEMEDQYTMRFSNAAGRGGISQPWYTADQKSAPTTGETQETVAYSGFEGKDVWGNEDPRRKERQQARISTSDPFAFMQKAQAQLQRSKLDKKKWAEERDRELRELRATQEREERVQRHRKRKTRHDVDEDRDSVARGHGAEHIRPSKSRHRDRRSRSRSRDRDRDRCERGHVHRRERRKSRSRSRDRTRHHSDGRSASQRDHDQCRSENSNRLSRV